MIMDIKDIKSQIGQEQGFTLGHLVMVQQFEQGTETPQPWVSHWENEKRVRVTMHQDVFNKLKAEPTYAGLALKHELVPATQTREAYHRYIVITPNHIVGTF